MNLEYSSGSSVINRCLDRSAKLVTSQTCINKVINKHLSVWRGEATACVFILTEYLLFFSRHLHPWETHDCSSKAIACLNKDHKKQNISTLNLFCNSPHKMYQCVLKPWAHHSGIQWNAGREKIRPVQWTKRLRFKYRTFLFPFRVNSVENLK